MLIKYRFSFHSHALFRPFVKSNFFMHNSDMNFISFCLFVYFFLATQRHHSLLSRSWREKHSSTSGIWDRASVWPSSPDGVKPSASDPALAPSIPAVSVPDMVSFNITHQHENHTPFTPCLCCVSIYVLFFCLEGQRAEF